MTQSLETFEISLKECRENWLNDFLSSTFASLESQGFTLEEILDSVTNYTWVNTNSIDAVCFLMQASLSLKKVEVTK
ncbi:MAG: hypothetical protein ACYT04_38520 [Nostoc sp.]